MLKKLNRKSAGVSQDRPVRILQFGGGNFLRAFADWIVDVLNEKTDFNGAIDIITSITPGTAEQINEQQGLYHLVQQGNKNGKPFSETRLITSVNSAINPSKDFQQFIQSSSNPHLRFIFSNTTESGIQFNENDRSPESLPESFPGKLTLLLLHRFNFFSGADDKTLIILPCELIEANGNTLKSMVLKYADLWNLSTEFKQWVSKNTFCNTLVDRIVPGFPKGQANEIFATTSFEDQLLVSAEPFYFWAIEAPSFVKEEFPVGKAGLSNIIFAEDITPYRTRKVRILNGAHTALTPVAYLRGIRTVKEAMDDEVTGQFIQDTIRSEIIPTLDLPITDLERFALDVNDRFANPFIKHLLISISLNSVSKFKVRVLPSVKEYIQRKNAPPQNLLQSLAALICFYRGRWTNEEIPLKDSPGVLKVFEDAWRMTEPSDTVHQILSHEDLWGEDISLLPGVADAVIRKVELLLQSEAAKP